MNIITILKSKLDKYSAGEKKIAGYIINNIESVKTLTSSELAQNIEVGQSTIIKFVKKTGFKGYQDFKLALYEYKVNDDNKTNMLHNDISIESSINEIYSKLIQENINSMNATFEYINKDFINESINKLNNANSIMLAGMGTSGLVVKDMYYKLLKIGKSSMYSEDMHVSYQIALGMKENDVCFIASHSGKTKELIKLAEILKEKNVSIILITEDENSPLGKIADIVLTYISNETFFRTSAMSSRITQLSIIDIIFLGLVKENYNTAMDYIFQSRNVTGWNK